MTQAAALSMVTAKDMQKAVLDLQVTAPGPGLRKTLVCALLTVPLCWLALTADHPAALVAWSIAAGITFSAWLITTHDAIHHTLTGWAWFDELLPRLLSHPLFWVHGMYAEVHKLHHKMNGDDLADPERVQFTEAEYAAASPALRFYIRHQWVFGVFVLGGIGLIYETVRSALSFYGKSKGIRRQVWLDVTGIVLGNALIYGIAIANGAALRYFVFWLIMERIGGGVLQWRAHVEHYGLWGKGRHYFETQAYNCRNLRTSRLASWYFNHLNFHSVHHAFPRVPFYQLETAHRRFQALFAAVPGEPLVEETGYFATALRLARAPSLIGAPDPRSPSGRRAMVPVG